MQNNLNRYFWDGSMEGYSEAYRLKRIIEYASFGDLIKYPFLQTQKYIDEIDINSLRTSRQRVEFIRVMKQYIKNSNSWNEVIKKYINNCFNVSK